MSQLKKKSSLYFLAGLTCFTWASSFCFSLPSAPTAQSGTVEIEYPNSYTMVINPSTGAVLQYEDFQIGLGEEVRILSKARHHILGENLSQILGSIQSSEKVVLINPHGIFFGADSKVQTGSLIVSTLDTTDPVHFNLLSGKESSIVSEGALRSQGSITLLAPHIRNLGSIEAYDVLLGSGKVVTIDGSNFSVEGSLQESLIEQLGTIKSSTVSIKLPLDKKTIVNAGETHEIFIEENGVISFGSASMMKAQKIHIVGSKISIQGCIDSTNSLDKGGSVYLFGKDISLEGARIDVSGLIGGGEVLIGGEFQGKGTTPYASKVIMDELSEIHADAIETGAGGLVVLWSQDHTFFDGKISAEGGSFSGNGGLVETSSNGKLEVVKGKVDTLSFSGEMGVWLLDPRFVQIGLSGSACSSDSDSYGDCSSSSSSCYLPTSVFQNLTTDLTIKAYCCITINASFNVTTHPDNPNKANVVFNACNDGDPTCDIYYPNDTVIPNTSIGVCSIGYTPASHTDTIVVTTDGGSLTFPPQTWLYQSFQIDTTKGGASGGNINIKDLYSVLHRSTSISLTAGSGTINLRTGTKYSADNNLQNITINSAGKVETNHISIHGHVSIPAPVYLTDNTSITSAGGDMYLAAVEGPGSLVCNAGSKYAVTLGSIGANVPVASFKSESFKAKSLTVSSKISTSSGDLSITTPMTITGDSIALTTQGGKITLQDISLVSSAKNLTLSAAAGSISVPALGTSFQSISLSFGKGTIGGTSVTSTISSGLLTVSSLTDGGTVSLTPTSEGGLTTNGKMSFASDSTVGGTFISSGSITAAGSLILAGNTSLQSLDGGITVGAQISSYVGNYYNLTLDAGLSPISLKGSVLNLASFTIANASETSFFDIVTQGPISITSPSVIKNAGSISSQGGDVFFSGTIRPIDENVDLIIYALSSDAKVKGTINVQAMGDESHYFGTISHTGGTIILGQDSSIFAKENVTFSGDLSLASSISTSGALNFSGTMNITGNTTLQAAGGITISSSITASSASPSLTLDAGNHPLTIPSLGSSANPFGVLTIKASSLILGGDVYSSSSIKIDSPITISTDIKINSAGVDGLILTKPVTVANGSVAPTLTLNATSAGALDLNSLGSDTAPLGAVSLSGSHVYLSGNIASSALVAISGPVTLFASCTLIGDKGISLDQDLSPNAGSMDLAMKASSGTVSLKNLGTDTSPLQNISIVSAGPIKPGNLICSGGVELSGTTITLGSNIAASSYIKITNTDLLTISSGTLNLTGDFIQSGTGDVSLAASIITPGSINFTGALTLTGDTALKGSTGITITGSISPQSNTPNLTLDAGTTPLTVNFLSSETNFFGSVTVSASNLILEGDVYASSAIKITPPITISANTTLNSLEGTGGITLLKAVTAAAGSGTPTLALYAVEGAANVNSLGSDTAPLGTITLIGDSVYLSGNITSTASLKITGPVYLLNDSSISLRSDTDITLDNSLIPNAGLCDLLMQSTGTVHVKDLGNSSYPLDEVSLTGSSIDLQGTITANSLEINGSSCTSGTCSSGTCPPWTYTSTACFPVEQ